MNIVQELKPRRKLFFALRVCLQVRWLMVAKTLRIGIRGLVTLVVRKRTTKNQLFPVAAG